MVCRNCLILLSLLWIFSICLVIYLKFENSILDGVWPAKIKDHISVGLQSLFLTLHTKDTFSLSMATLHCCLMGLMGIWVSSSENTISLHLGLVKHLFIRKSDVTWPCHKGDLIGFHHQHVQREMNVWFRMLTVIKIPFPSLHPWALLPVFAAFSASLSSLGANAAAASAESFWFTFNRKRRKHLFPEGATQALEFTLTGKTWSCGHLWPNHRVQDVSRSTDPGHVTSYWNGSRDYLYWGHGAITKREGTMLGRP